MKLELEIYNALCATKVFKINDIYADHEDFGEQFDRDPDNAEPYCCEDMEFTRIPSTPEVLNKYGINEEEYNEVCEALEKGLSFGCCGWCE